MSIDECVLHAWAAEAGFYKCALCDVNSFDDERSLTESQPPLKERSQLRFAPSEDYEQVRSLAVLLWAYHPAELPDRGYVFVDSYYDASNAAYHAAKELEKRLLDAGCFAKANVSYPAKRAAVRAGLGVIGKNSLLITPEHGTRVVIILMAVGIDVSNKEKRVYSPSECASCGRCISACPTGALSEGGMIHPERCLRNYMLEGIVVPDSVRPMMGRTMIGCDICQRVCPMQPKLETQHSEALLLADFVTEDKAAFAESVTRLSQRIGKNAARPQRIRAQAAILAGNSRNPAFLPVLDVWAQSSFDAVAQHARWAAERIRSEVR